MRPNYFYNFPSQPHGTVVSARIGALSASGVSASFTKSATWCAKSGACASNRARRANWWRRCWRRHSRRILIAIMPGGWASDIENFRRHGSRGVLQKLLHARQHHHRHRRRRESRGGAEAGRKIFRAILPRGPLPPLVRARSSPNRTAKSAWPWNRPRSRFWRSCTSVPISIRKDDAALDVLSDMLSGGRTGIIYKELVRDKKIALAARQRSRPSPAENIRRCSSFSWFHPAATRSRKTKKRCYEIIEHVKKEKIDAETLKRVKTKLRAELIRKLDSNSGLAAELCSYSVRLWRLAQAVHRTRRIQQDHRRRCAARREDLSDRHHQNGRVYVRAGAGRRQMRLTPLRSPPPRWFPRSPFLLIRT